jgi:hypothetical protein
MSRFIEVTILDEGKKERVLFNFDVVRIIRQGKGFSEIITDKSATIISESIDEIAIRLNLKSQIPIEAQFMMKPPVQEDNF